MTLAALSIDCGGRSVLDDFEEGDFGDAGGSQASGGRGQGAGGRGQGAGGRRADGGAATGGSAIASSGGVNAGGSASGGGPFAGGSVGAGGAEPCPDGSFGDGRTCEEWTTCEGGEYVRSSGSPSRDRKCAACPPNSFSRAPNQSACRYSGCAFSERAVSPATPTSAADCEPDPDYFELGSTYPTLLVGLVALGPRAYAGVTTFENIELRGYQPDMMVETKTIALAPDNYLSTFALAPDGSIYLSGYAYTDALSWLERHDSDLSSSARIAIGDLRYSSYAISLLATDAHWIHHRVDYGSNYAELVLSASPHPDLTPSEVRARIGNPFAIAAVDRDAIWVLANQGEARLYRMLDFAPPLMAVDLPGTFSPRLIAVAPSGSAYVVGMSQYSNDRAQIVELDPSGMMTRSWDFEPDEGDDVYPATLSVDQDRAVYVTFSSGRYLGNEYAVSGTDVVMLRIDLLTNQTSTKKFVGPGADWVSFSTVTSEGAVYLAGGSDSMYYVRRVF